MKMTVPKKNNDSKAKAKKNVEPKESKPKGRPTKYKSDYCTQALKMSILGATDEQLADFFEVSESTLNLWKIEHPDFSESIKRGKEEADANVAASLYKRATGCSVKETKVFIIDDKPVKVEIDKNFPPDATSALFWLKNRQPKLWRDTKVIQGDAENPQHIVWNEEKTYEAPKTEDEK